MRRRFSSCELDNICFKENSYSSCEECDPSKTWSGNKPSFEHFRMFRCVTHVHTPNKRTKLQDKSFPYAFFGVSEKSKAYRLFDPRAKKIVDSRDIMFEED